MAPSTQLADAAVVAAAGFDPSSATWTLRGPVAPPVMPQGLAAVIAELEAIAEGDA